jgi:hypothetical protein
MFTRNIAGHTTAKNHSQYRKLQNPKVVLSTSMKMRQEPNSKFSKSNGDLRTYKSFWLLKETHATNGTQNGPIELQKHAKHHSGERLPAPK